MIISLPPLSRLRERLRSPWMVAGKLALVLALAAGVSLQLAGASSAESRFLAAHQAQAKADEAVTRVGMATMGDVYLATQTTNETAGLSSETLKRLEIGLDPACSGAQNRTDCVRPGSGRPSMGALFPLRKGVEQMAGFLAFALALVSLAHGMFVGKVQGGESRAVSWVINFLCVWLLMYMYPVWDYVIYKQMAQSIVKQLENGQIKKDMVFAITGSTTLDTSTPTLELGAIWTNDMDCVMLISQASDLALAEKCFGDRIPEERRLTHAQSLRSAMGGSPREQALFIEELAKKHPTIGKNIVDAFNKIIDGGLEALKNSSPPEGEEEGMWGYLVNKVVGVVDKVISTTLTGFITTIVNVIGAAVLWLVKLATVVARAISFTFAPIAIIWCLAPTRGEPNLENAMKWYKGHAKIALWPVGIHFGLLLFYILYTAINTTEWVAGAAPIGLAVKLALFFAFLAVCFKSGTLTNVIAGDITAVAADFGRAAAQKTVQVAGTAVKMGAMAGGGALVAGAGGMAGGGMMGKVGATLSKGSGALNAKLTTLGSRGGAIGTAARGLKGGLGWMGDSAAGAARKGRAAKRLGGMKVDRFARENPKTAGAARFGGKVMVGTGKLVAKGAIKGTVKGAKYTKLAFDNRVRSNEVPEIPFMGSKGSMNPLPLMRSVMNPLDDALKDIRTRNQQKVAAVDSDASRELKDHVNALKENTRALRERYNVERPTIRERERIEVRTEKIQPPANISPEALAMGARVLSSIVNGQQTPVTLNVNEANGIRSYQMEPESAAAVHRMMGQDPVFAQQIHQVAMRRYGKDDKIPRVASEHGAVIDINALLRDDTETASAFEFAARGSAERDREVVRRELLSAKMSHSGSSIQKNSLSEYVLRSLSEEQTMPLPGEENADGTLSASYTTRIEGLVNQILRAAYRMPQGNALEPEWSMPGSTAVLDASQIATLNQAMQQVGEAHERLRAERFLHNGAVPLGLNIQHFMSTGERQYDAQIGSRYQNIEARERERTGSEPTPEMVYKLALAEIQSQLPSREPNESEHEYQMRRQSVINEALFVSVSRQRSPNA